MVVLKVVSNGRNGLNKKILFKFILLYLKGVKIILFKIFFKDILK